MAISLLGQSYPEQSGEGIFCVDIIVLPPSSR